MKVKLLLKKCESYVDPENCTIANALKDAGFINPTVEPFYFKAKKPVFHGLLYRKIEGVIPPDINSIAIESDRQGFIPQEVELEYNYI